MLSIFKKQTAFEVIGGQNYFNKARFNQYKMVNEKKVGDGVVKIKGKHYYYLGSQTQEQYKRSAGKAAAGAIVGGVLTGGIGAVAGAAVGGRRKDDSVFWLHFADYETKQQFSVQVKQIKTGQIHMIKDFKPVNPREIGLEDFDITNT